MSAPWTSNWEFRGRLTRLAIPGFSGTQHQTRLSPSLLPGPLAFRAGPIAGAAAVRAAPVPGAQACWAGPLDAEHHVLAAAAAAIAGAGLVAGAVRAPELSAAQAVMAGRHRARPPPPDECGPLRGAQPASASLPLPSARPLPHARRYRAPHQPPRQSRSAHSPSQEEPAAAPAPPSDSLP
jgi:hypothetical protein